MSRLNPTQKIGLFVTLALLAILTAFHNPFGGYYQSEVLYSKTEFLKSVRESFPEYADLPDDTLYVRLLTKYPNFRSWIREEATGSAVLPVSISGKPTNFRLKPPPAYYGERSTVRSVNALFGWIDQPSEYFGFAVPTALLGLLWVLLFKQPK